MPEREQQRVHWGPRDEVAGGRESEPSGFTLILLAVEALAALDAEAVASQVVMTAGRADQPSWRVGLQPAFSLAPVPDAIFWAKHPSPALAVKNGQVAHRESEGSGLKTSGPPFLDQGAIADLGIGKRIDSHAESIA
jgi:hypothetical protein